MDATRQVGLCSAFLGFTLLAWNAWTLANTSDFSDLPTVAGAGLLLGGTALRVLGARRWWLASVSAAVGLVLGIVLVLEWNSNSPSPHPLVMMLVGE